MAGRVLIIDDEENIRQKIRLSLEPTGSWLESQVCGSNKLWTRFLRRSQRSGASHARRAD